jgi:nitrite reductase/ring-hydroxylating ferredoxin subunit
MSAFFVSHMTPTESDPEGFVTALPSSRVKANDITFVEIETHPIVLIRIEGTVRAFSAICPHQLGDLSHGLVYRCEIECPAHQWRFDLRSGQSVYPEEESLALRFYEVKEDAGMIKIKLPPDRRHW